jgi:hypothetical protein
LRQASHLFWMVLLLLFASWIGARGLNADPIWIDEYWSIYNAGGAHYGPLSPAEIFNRIATEDIWHVPLYYLLIGGWGSLVGWSHVALRALSLLFGLLSIAMAYRLGRDLHSPLAGLGAAVAVGASAYYLYYFHELRGYTLNVLLSEIVIWSYWRASRTYSRFALAMFFLSALAILYTHYLAALVLAALGLYHLLIAPKDRMWWQITGTAVLAGMLFLPWLGVTLRAWREASAPDNVALRDWGPGALALNPLLIYTFGNGALALPLIAGWFALRTPANDKTMGLSPLFRTVSGFAWFLLLALLLLALLFNLLIALFVVMRYLLPLWGVLALLVGIGVARMRPPYNRLFLIAWVIGGVWNSLSPPFMTSYIDTRLLSHTPWHQIAPALDRRMQPGDTAAFLLPDDTWWVWQDWVHGFYLHDLQQRGLTTKLVESYPQISDREYRRDARTLNPPHLWLGYHPEKPPLAWWTYTESLTDSYVLCPAPIILNGYRLDLYTRIPQQPDYSFDDQAGIALVEPIWLEGGILRAVFGIALDNEINPQAYSVGLHVVDESGTTVAQDDFALFQRDQPVAYRCAASAIDVSALPTGEYALYALIYDWQTGARVATREGDRLLLEQFSIR